MPDAKKFFSCLVARNDTAISMSCNYSLGCRVYEHGKFDIALALHKLAGKKFGHLAQIIAKNLCSGAQHLMLLFGKGYKADKADYIAFENDGAGNLREFSLHRVVERVVLSIEADLFFAGFYHVTIISAVLPLAILFVGTDLLSETAGAAYYQQVVVDDFCVDFQNCGNGICNLCYCILNK